MSVMVKNMYFSSRPISGNKSNFFYRKVLVYASTVFYNVSQPDKTPIKPHKNKRGRDEQHRHNTHPRLGG